MHRFVFSLAATGLFVAGGCSVVIDVPANCSDSDCAPYVCEPDGIACGDTCAGNDECGSGFVCDVEAAECIETGCRPAFEPLHLVGLPPTISEFDMDVGGSPEQFLVVASRREGLGFQRFTVNGTAVTDPMDSELGMVRLADANYQRLPYFPTVSYADADAAQADGGTPRFVVGWRAASEAGESLRVGTFVVNPATAPSSRTLASERSHFGVAGLDLAPDGIGLLAAWQATSGQISEVRVLGADIRGNAGDALTRTVSTEDIVAGTPAVGTYGSLTFVAYSRTKDGARNVIAAAYDDQWALQGEIVLVDDRPASAFDVEDLAMVPTASGLAVAWAETGSVGRAAYAAFFGADVIDALDPETAVVVPPFRLDGDWTGTRDVRASQDLAGYAVGWVGEQRGWSDIWIQRVGLSGSAPTAPLPVTDGHGADVAEYRVARTSDGLAVAWLVEGSSAAGAYPDDRVFYRRFVCAN